MRNFVSQSRCDILIPGHYACDLIFTGIPGFPALGTELYAERLTVVPGGCLNTVTGLRRLGVSVGWLGMLGSDLFSRVIDDWLRQEAIDRSWVIDLDAPLKRVTVALSYVDDRAFVTRNDPSPSLIEPTLKAITADECAHVHYSGLLIDPRAPELLRACRTHGIMVTSDCQHRPVTLDDPLVHEIISGLDIFMPNASEAQQLTQTPSIDRAAAILRDRVPLLVIKDGERGAHVWQGDQHWSAPALPIGVIDTTGAGDLFNAGFLTAYREQADLPTCLRWGIICGGLSTQGYGGVSAAPTRAEVEQWMQKRD